jgi:hypothetical protein
MRLFEEAEMLERFEESGEVVTDATIQDKLYKRWQKTLQETKGTVSNDDLDMVEI